MGGARRDQPRHPLFLPCLRYAGRRVPSARAPTRGDPLRRIRRTRHGADGRRTLRRHLVHGGAAHQRDWHSRGTGGRSGRRDRAHSARGGGCSRSRHAAGAGRGPRGRGLAVRFWNGTIRSRWRPPMSRWPSWRRRPAIFLHNWKSVTLTVPEYVPEKLKEVLPLIKPRLNLQDRHDRRGSQTWIINSNY